MNTTLTNNTRFLRACRREETDCTPVWFMRQAGRYMPEYRAIRERHGFLDMVKTPELAAEITLQPANAFDVDAAIIFADILPPLEGMGLELTYEQGEGPIIHNPIRSAKAVAALRQPDPRETVAYTLDAIRVAQRELGGRIPLIGFSGAPFTLAAYAIEGGGSKEYRRTKLFMYQEPEAWHALMAKLAQLVGDYLTAQIEAGADAVQIFDSWAGVLAPNDYAEYVLPYVQQVVSAVRSSQSAVRSPQSDTPNWQLATGDWQLPPVPIVYFGTNMNGMLSLLRQLDVDVIGVDWRIGLDEAWAQLGPGFAVQGNLEPAVLHAPWSVVERRAADVLARAAGRPGHIFNLGHGILTETPVENVRRLIEYVHEASGDMMTR
jgi:uroporphyrinogen decarboxylase